MGKRITRVVLWCLTLAFVCGTGLASELNSSFTELLASKPQGTKQIFKVNAYFMHFDGKLVRIFSLPGNVKNPSYMIYNEIDAKTQKVMNSKQVENLSYLSKIYWNPAGNAFVSRTFIGSNGYICLYSCIFSETRKMENVEYNSVNWFDNENYLKLGHGGLDEYTLGNFPREMLGSSSGALFFKTDTYRASQFEISPDQQQILIAYEYRDSKLLGSKIAIAQMRIGDLQHGKREHDRCMIFDATQGVYWLDDDYQIIKENTDVKVLLYVRFVAKTLFREKAEFAKTVLVHHFNPTTRHLAVLCHSQQKVYVYNDKFEQINCFGLDKDTPPDITIALDDDDNLWHN